VIVLDTVGSTNDELRRLAATGAPEGTVVVAEHQLAGRGRRGREWFSPPGVGLYLSVLFRPMEEPVRLTRWTLAASIAACEACRRSSGRAVEIEWPNDLFFEGRKLAGILAETRTTGSRTCDMVVGAGINVHQRADDFPPELATRAISLRRIGCAGMLEREGLAVDLLRRLAVLATALRRGDWSSVAKRWERLAPGARDRPVRILAGNSGPPIIGLTRGLDESGALRVESEDGKVIAVRLADAVEPLES
jgi:BirA family biotin operon repressor/biotin-[acetyl-CoA-carboxylase] ligase